VVLGGPVGQPISCLFPVYGEDSTKRMSQHPDLADEQAYIDFAYACLERSRQDAWRLRDLTEAGRGGTHQARYERDVFEEALFSRLSQLDLHDEVLVFGRIDRPSQDGVTAEGDPSSSADVESFHLGRLAVADDHREPVVIDWRAPVAEPFYRATGRDPMGLVRRRHFAVKGRQLLDIEDELFGAGHLGIGEDIDGENGDAPKLRGYSSLIAALEQGRTGRLGDIVATIQAEQDEIIRSSQAGVLVVQGGPGTGKTVVALHRAAYLLYTYRFPLEDQGVLVIGPNRLFLRYIERVLPSLGEAGVEEVVLGDLAPGVRFGGHDSAFAARVKGDARMADVVAKAIYDRERPLKQDLVVAYGLTSLRLTAAESNRIVRSARRRFRRHNAGRRFVETEVFAALAASSREAVSPEAVRDRTRTTDVVREALERMWPVLTPAELLHDLFGSPALLKLAASRWLTEEETASLHRRRVDDLDAVRWTDGDVALLDEARELLGPRPARKARAAENGDKHSDEIRTYGHIVIDEAQDLTPMQLRMAARRSLNGSMTVVGDIAQATGPHAPRDWSDILRHLPDRRPARVADLTVGYRIPAQTMALASRVLRIAAPALTPPTSIRQGDAPPEIVRVDPAELGAAVVAGLERLSGGVTGSTAVVVPDSLIEPMTEALRASGLAFGVAPQDGLDAPVTLVSVSLVKGLELDGVVVVEPARIVAEEVQGMRALYVALTRATKALAVVHAEPLPEALVD
jgi:DNA helicase IV